MQAATEQVASRAFRVMQWVRQYVNDKQFTLVLAFFIGLFSSVAAYVLHWLIKEIQMLLTAGFNIASANWLYLVFPVIGIYITSLFVK